MGNNSTKEARGSDSANPMSRTVSGSGQTSSGPATLPSRGARGSNRPDLSFLGIGSAAAPEQPERRETKQEREARKLEKERVAREKERERSLREEHVDGGFLVTMGVYTGTEDFSKPTVRQLMIERRIAPFWRGLDDFKEEWTEHQLVAAGRGLPIPAADEIPPEDISRPQYSESPRTSNQNIHSLTVPIVSRSHSAASDASTTLSPSHPAFSLPSPTSPLSPQAPQTSHSPFRPRSKTLASLTSSKTAAQPEILPREVQLPKDPYVNGQALEVFLYKDAIECPICFLYYPPYLNKTRCCDQLICSECFVQIKRPDPHPPEHEHNDASSPAPPPTSEEPESLVSEPATCPYCQQPEFGVTYDAPPIRKGLAYANTVQGIANSPAMSSSTSLNSAASPTLAPVERNRRRATSIAANAPTVITTDRVRPDWATKLANARSHLARRSAAATALHSAAYLMGNTASDNRSFGFTGRSRFGRHRGDSGSNPASGSATPATGTAEPSSRLGDSIRDGARTSSRRRSRIEDLEDMMMMEAIRLSLAAEEERKKKSDKEAQKEAKKRAKEEKKKEKRERKVYGSGANSANGSALSLSLPGIGRRRGNSGASHLAREVTPEVAEGSEPKGKGIDRGSAATTAPIDVARANSSHGFAGSRHLEANASNDHQPSPTAPDKPSHLRQMSTASSHSSNLSESVPNSIRNGVQGSSSSLDVTNNERRDEDGTEPLFNFRSLAGMLGNEDPDDKDVARHIEHLENGAGESSNPFASMVQPGHSRNSSHTDDLVGLDLGLEASVSTLKSDKTVTQKENERLAPSQEYIPETHRTTPEVMITPVTPAAMSSEHEHGKQLGSSWSHSAEITQ
ncbi:hypothetical protein PVAG01_03500 [Phlyctema vagabunda]|uniref:Protein sip5 n=1 Tax=Phlyctema vagabunda TaxID=108571 RepID=A0ABR4PLK2_9HELO